MPVPEELNNIKFAGFLESIKILYQQDDRFKTICDDYCLTRMDTEKYKKKIDKCFGRKKRCENLSLELEEEILIYLIRRV